MTPITLTYKRVYCLYRVSTKGQVDKDDIPMQKQSCREFAERQNGWVIKKEFQEKGVSGFKISAKDRDAIQEIKVAAERKEFDILLVFMFDRIIQLKREVRELKKNAETYQRKLTELNEEIANTLIGESLFTIETLSSAIKSVKAKLLQSNEQLMEKEKQLDSKKSDMGNVDYYYDQFRSWADELDEASQERKRLIICKLFKEINVGRGYQIEMLMDTSYQHFIQ